MSPNSAIPRLLIGVLACMACTSLLVAKDQEGVHVCIGADHVVRHAPRAPCGSGAPAERHGRTRLHHGEAQRLDQMSASAAHSMKIVAGCSSISFSAWTISAAS